VLCSTPGFHSGLRAKVIEALQDGGFKPLTKAVYTQTQGPRFETPAEIRTLALSGDLVGMTW
jgi:purine nucleoside phosphorylase